MLFHRSGDNKSWRCGAKVCRGNSVTATIRMATIRMGRIIICDQMNRPQKWPETMSEWSYSCVWGVGAYITGSIDWPEEIAQVLCREGSLVTATAPFNNNMHRTKLMDQSHGIFGLNQIDEIAKMKENFGIWCLCWPEYWCDEIPLKYQIPMALTPPAPPSSSSSSSSSLEKEILALEPV